MNGKDITLDFVKTLLPERNDISNKGTYGKVLNIAGCKKYQGAAYLSSLTPLKCGAGLVTLATITDVINNLAGNCPWVTFLPLRDCEKKCIASDSFNDLKTEIKNYNAISAGPGLSDESPVEAFIIDLIHYIKQSETKCVIDADAINLAAKTEIKEFSHNTVITPHPMELSRLIGIPLQDIQNDRIKYARYTAEKYKCAVVLKGHKTVICSPDMDIFINNTGNSALAKAGSGDVLTGLIAGFMAQGLTSINAAILGVYIHGLCGDFAAEDLTQYCVLATDQIDYIPKAIKYILEN